MTVSAAARAAADGDTVEIESGDYLHDVAVWTQKKLTIRGVRGRVRLVAAGAAAEGKAIWVLRGGAFIVENVEFRGTRVPHRNGAGIRLEKGQLTVRNCLFRDNQNGILTSGSPDSELEIEASEFSHNGAGDGQTHNLYVGAIRKLQVRNSYFHHARVGHLLKSRARENHIFYNRFTDEIGGTASYELEFPNGGLAYVVGNLIQQSSQTSNGNMVAFGLEGYKWAHNELHLINNTLVDDRPRNGRFLLVKQGTRIVRVVNNLLLGTNKLESPGLADYYGSNHQADWPDFVMPQREDYRLRRTSVLAGKAVDPGQVHGVNLRPLREYVHPLQSKAVALQPYSPGAFQMLIP